MTIRRDSWTPEEDALVTQILMDSAHNGETQKMAITRASNAIGRTYEAVAFRWYGELRKTFASEFEQAQKEGRYRKGKIRSIRVPDYASTFDKKGYKLTDKVISDVLGKDVAQPQPFFTPESIVEDVGKEAPPAQDFLAELAKVQGEPYVYEPAEPVIVEGVGKDAPTTVNEHGGKQSASLYRMDLLDPRAILETSKVLKEGADKYGAENWRLISIDDHLNHLIVHAYAYLAGDKSDEHLSHAVCRALFALGVELQDKPKQQGE